MAFRVDLEHMQYLTPDSCSYLSAELNLRIVHLETLGFPNLKDIEKPFAQTVSHANLLKRMIKSVPGFSTINALRHLFEQKRWERDDRTGGYHLFVIMQKPS